MCELSDDVGSGGVVGDHVQHRQSKDACCRMIVFLGSRAETEAYSLYRLPHLSCEVPDHLARIGCSSTVIVIVVSFVLPILGSSSVVILNEWVGLSHVEILAVLSSGSLG